MVEVEEEEEKFRGGCFGLSIERKERVTWQKGIIHRRGEACDHRADCWLSGSRGHRFSVMLGVMLSPDIELDAQWACNRGPHTCIVFPSSGPGKIVDIEKMWMT